MSLHPDEFTITDALVRELVDRQLPEYSSLAIEQYDSSGTVHAVFRLGLHMAVRLPRAPAFATGPVRLQQTLHRIPTNLGIRVPALIAVGQPTERYPSHWSVIEWIDGINPTIDDLKTPQRAASDLGNFVKSLHQIDPANAPAGGSYRAAHVSSVDSAFRQWTERLPAEINRISVLSVWERCIAASPWDGEPVWLHSDLRGDNMIARDGGLVAIIDWDEATVGDPSADHIAAWWLFDGDSRAAFRTASAADADTWRRAMGWALHMAVAAIPYYHASNPAFAAQARRALDAILVDAAES